MFDHYISAVTNVINEVSIIPAENTNDAAIFDLDECCISSFVHHMSGILTKYSSFEEVISTFTEHDSPPIKPVLEFYSQLLNLNYNIFFLTGRPNNEILVKRTKDNLTRAGYRGYQNIFFMPSNCSYSNVAFFKKAIRDMLTAQGYNIIYNLGDQNTDFVGSKATFNIRLPNPLY